MFQVLIEINHFQQLSAVAPELADKISGLIQSHARDYGAQLRHCGPGRMILGFQLHRHSDTAFILECMLRLKQGLEGMQDDLYGFSIIVENTSADDDGERVFKSLLLDARESYGLWLGPQVQQELSQFLLTQQAGRLLKVLRIQEKTGTDYSLIHERFLESPDIRQTGELIRTAMDGMVGSSRMAFISNNDPEVSTVVQAALAEYLGLGRDFLWLQGQDEKDPATLALVRGIFPQDLDLVEAYIPLESKALWHLGKNFLFQTAHANIGGLKGSRIPPQNPGKIFAIAFNIFFAALIQRSQLKGRPLVVHVDRFTLFHDHARSIIVDLMAREQGILWIFSGTENDDIPAGAGDIPVHIIPSLSGMDLGRMGIFPGQLSGVFAPLMRCETLGYRLALILQFLQGNLPGDAADIEVPAGGMEPVSNYKAQEIILTQLMKQADPVLSEMLYICAVTYGFLGLEELTAFFEVLSIERIRIPGLIRQMHMLGLIRDEELCFPVYPGTLDILENFLGNQAGAIRAQLCDFLMERIEDRHVPMTVDVILLFKELGAQGSFFALLDRYTRECLDAGDIGTVELMLQHGTHALKEADSSSRHDFALTLSYLEARLAMENGDIRQAREAFGRVDKSHLNGDAGSQGYLDVLKGRFLFLFEGVEAGLPWIKKGIMDFQDSGVQKGLSDAQRMFGHIMFVKERLLESREYFMLARNNAADQHLLNEELWAELHESQINFILGYHSRILAKIEDNTAPDQKALDAGRFSLAQYFRFLQGRSFFELGMYELAIDMWKRCHELAVLMGDQEPQLLARRWMARARIYQGGSREVLKAFQDDASPESLFFTAEAHWLWNDPKACLEALGKIRHENPGRYLPEKILWNSGFAFMEDRMFMEEGKTMLERLCQLLGLHAQGLVQDAEIASHALSQFNRNLKKTCMDPNQYWYLFLQADSLSRVDKSVNEDRATVLGKSVKFFQERASRLENPLHKKSFMKENVWNRRLLNEAKKFNLA